MIAFPKFIIIMIHIIIINIIIFYYQYKLGNSLILPTDCIKDLGVHIDYKLHFHHHIDFLSSLVMKLLGLIRTITFSFSTIDSLLMLYLILVRSKLEYASAVWNSVTITDSNKLERIQRKFAALYYNRFFQDTEYHYNNLLEKLNFLTLHKRRRHSDALFLINVFSGAKCCSSVLETVGIRVPTRNIRNFTPFCCSPSHCPSARCVSAANAVCKCTDIFRNSGLNINNLN
jgi:hypothetical protein